MVITAVVIASMCILTAFAVIVEWIDELIHKQIKKQE
jgi:hypothetical protein